MATEKFQRIVWQIIKRCPDAYNLHDDLRIVGADDKEHNEKLDKVMHKLEESDLTLNYEKCGIGASSMIYIHTFTDWKSVASEWKLTLKHQRPRTSLK